MSAQQCSAISLGLRGGGRIVVSDLRVADGYWSRLLGLQFRSAIPVGQGLLMTNSGSIHTFWMRFAIDVAFINESGQVIGVRKNLRPWRITLAPRKTYAVLETTAGWLQLQSGDLLEAKSLAQGGASHRASLEFLQAHAPEAQHA